MPTFPFQLPFQLALSTSDPGPDTDSAWGDAERQLIETSPSAENRSGSGARKGFLSVDSGHGTHLTQGLRPNELPGDRRDRR